MPSSLITFPENNQDIAADQTFNIKISMTNMELGHFTNAQLTYYSAPTKLNGAGLIIGHTHITCQVSPPTPFIQLLIFRILEVHSLLQHP
jgi:transcription initiation factor TFIID subunit 15